MNNLSNELKTPVALDVYEKISLRVYRSSPTLYDETGSLFFAEADVEDTKAIVALGDYPVECLDNAKRFINATKIYSQNKALP